jgi:hypothetical protein
MEHEILNTQEAVSLAISSIKAAQKLIILGTQEDFEMLEENAEFSGDTPQEIIQKSIGISASEWFANARQQREEDYQMDLSDSEGEWPDELPPEQESVLIRDFSTGDEKEEVSCLKMAVDESWKIPAELKYGGWNECPYPEVHCALWRYWQEKYGAHIIGVSSDIIEAYVEKPPTTQEEAMALAQEQYLYCADIVDQGTETVANLAAALLNSKLWFFWWD